MNICISNLEEFPIIFDKSKAIPSNRLKEICFFLQNVDEQIAVGTISEEKAKKISKPFIDEMKKAFCYLNKAEFKKFCENANWVEEWFLHEEEHARVYEKYKVPHKYGIKRILSNDEKLQLQPFVEADFDNTNYDNKKKLEIYLESLKTAKSPSHGDIPDIERIESLLKKI